MLPRAEGGIRDDIRWILRFTLGINSVYPRDFVYTPYPPKSTSENPPHTRTPPPVHRHSPVDTKIALINSEGVFEINVEYGKAFCIIFNVRGNCFLGWWAGGGAVMLTARNPTSNSTKWIFLEKLRWKNVANNFLRLWRLRSGPHICAELDKLSFMT